MVWFHPGCTYWRRLLLFLHIQRTLWCKNCYSLCLSVSVCALSIDSENRYEQFSRWMAFSAVVTNDRCNCSKTGEVNLPCVAFWLWKSIASITDTWYNPMLAWGLSFWYRMDIVSIVIVCHQVMYGNKRGIVPQQNYIGSSRFVFVYY